MEGFHTITLGCKLNRFDSAAIEGELARRGFRPQPDVGRAAIVVVNTCTVTAKADAEARRLIRAVRRRNPDCRLLVTGCYAARDAEVIRSIAGVDLVFGNDDKPRIAALLDRAGLHGAGGCESAPPTPAGLYFGDRSRAFLRVQEGCDLRCSYCVIPSVRGASRSVPPDQVERALRSLLAAGYREVVLTGVNTGDYGKDLAPATDLASLLRRLLAMLGPNRIRLNSLEPLTVTDEIIALMAGDPRLAPHLQVPLQSGSSTLLRRMRRNYRLSSYLERVEAVRRAVPDAGLGADVIVGFPGETDALFEETRGFIESSPLNYLHVFSWSPRPGTTAASLPDRPHGAVVRERSRRLRALASRLGYRFRRGFEGRTLDAIVLGSPSDGTLRVLSGNFIELTVAAGKPVPRSGDLVAVRVRHAGETATWGDLAAQSRSRILHASASGGASPAATRSSASA